MWGPQPDVPGECNARLYIADDYGDNHATMRCQKPKGHDGLHEEKYCVYGNKVVVTWTKDEREEEGEKEASLA